MPEIRRNQQKTRTQTKALKERLVINDALLESLWSEWWQTGISFISEYISKASHDLTFNKSTECIGKRLVSLLNVVGNTLIRNALRFEFGALLGYNTSFTINV